MKQPRISVIAKATTSALADTIPMSQPAEVSRSEPSAEADSCFIPPSAKSKEKKAIGI